jgi:acetylornithine/N-succinyldiaminopimelate aminotransferase
MIDWKEIADRFEAPAYARYPVVFESGDDVYLTDTSGKRYVDLYGGHCVSILGHSPKSVIDAISEQSRRLMFYSNVVYSPVRASASRKLVTMAPEGFDRVFFCNSGTEANENAIKLAWKMTGRKGIASTIGGWHGRTLASLSVTHSPKLRIPYQFALPSVDFVPFGDAEALDQCFKKNPDIASFILEPIQSINGCNTAPDQYFRDIRNICNQHGVMLIFDEIQTGVGRTGKFSYSEHVDIKPDLITLAKSLAAGFPIGAVLMPERVASDLKIGDLGSTFAGGMLACAACEATLNEIESKNYMSNASLVFDALSEQLSGTDLVVRGKGCLIGIHLPCESKAVVGKLFNEGWITGTSDVPDVMRIMPPIITPINIIKEFATALKEIVYAQ